MQDGSYLVTGQYPETSGGGGFFHLKYDGIFTKIENDLSVCSNLQQ